ncbi:MAG: MBOAT family protein [Butyrivibrio sp.]|nr:MBOAT family protein [Butyrivibrio sp.]
MSFISFAFMVFLPIAVLVNFLIPKRFRYIWLFVVSMAFYASAGVASMILLLVSIASVYSAGIWLERRKDKAKLILILSLVFNLGILFVFKYLYFFLRIVGIITFTDLGAKVHINLIMPLGLSFYILKSVGYLIDVYRGDIEAERNVVKFALFVSFFPQIVAGPIERAGNMIRQFENPISIDFDRFRNGLLEILWGYFLKLVIAERLAMFVEGVFSSGENTAGAVSFVAILFYTFEIYADFAGYSCISIGIARILGIDVMKNFECPYLSMSVAEFWRRWHISLSSWLRDYLYIPLGGNRKGELRRYLNILIVFTVSGLWHGADFTFLIWGLLHGIYQVIGRLTMPVRDRMSEMFGIGRSSFSHRVAKTVGTFLLVSYAWVFFRADDPLQAVNIIVRSFAFTPWKYVDGSLYLYGLNRTNYMLALGGIILMIVVDLFNNKGIVIREKILAQGLWLRWLIMIVGILATVILGIWGPGYNVADFIYKQF